MNIIVTVSIEILAGSLVWRFGDCKSIKITVYIYMHYTIETGHIQQPSQKFVLLTYYVSDKVFKFSDH